jgi:hypothetical protein
VIDPHVALDRTVLVLQDYVDASADEIVSTLSSLRVRISADAATLAEPTARAALVATFESVVRLGVEVVLDLPREIQSPHIPPLRDDCLFMALDCLASDLIRPLGGDGACDLRITLNKAAAPDELSVGGSDFCARLCVGRGAGGWNGEFPFGAMLAGAAAGAEVARLAVRKLMSPGVRPRNPIVLEHRDLSIALPPFAYNAEAGIVLGDVDFVSAGAVTQAALFTLAHVPNLKLQGRVFDDDVAAEDNINRYFLLDARGLGLPKVDQLAQIRWPAFELMGVPARVGESDDRVAQPLGALVCVGVDSVEARWAIQRLAPGWIAVGATTHALAMASEHLPETACGGCVHSESEALAERLPTISFVSLLAGALLAFRLVRHAIAPISGAEVAIVLDAFNLAAAQPFVIERVTAVPHCPVGCAPSKRERVRRAAA